MTFYWWSHWFWITLLSNILLPFRFVHTYPSQGVTPDYNSNSDEKHTKPATKLYHTSSTLIWATMATTFAADRKQVDLAAGQAAIRRPPSNPSTVGMEAKTVGEEAANSGSSQSAREEVNTSTSAEYEFKRSTEEKSSARVHDEFVTALSERRQSNRGTEAEAGAEQTQGSGGAAIASEKAANTTQQEELRKLYGSNNSSWIATSTDDSSAQAVPSPGGPSSSRHSARLEAESERRSRDERPNDRTQQLQDQQADAVDGRPLAGHKAPFTLENVNKQEEILRAENEHRTRKSKVLSAEYNHVSRFINLSTDSRNLLTRSALSASTEHDSDGSNISSEALAIQRPTHFLDAGAISAICFTVFAVCCTVGTLGVLMYRRRFLNKPQALSEPDSSVYIDDSTMRDNSDEMYSLDNDSFLNSLEAMTIQNYWTDTVKHTKL